MADAGLPLQKALYALLTEMLAPVPVYDDVPPDTPTTYVTIGDVVSADDGDKTAQGQEHVAAIFVWSKGDTRGREAVKTVLASIYDALHEQEAALAIEGHTTVMVICEASDSVRTADPALWSGIARYRVLTESQ